MQKKLKYEDAYNDLQLFLIIKISMFDCENIKNKSDGALVNYIEKSIYHEYIKLSKKNDMFDKEMIGVEDDNIIEVLGGKEDDYSFIWFDELKNNLSDIEYKVIIGLYYNNLSVKELAYKMNNSIWNIYKIKKKALNKIQLNSK